MYDFEKETDNLKLRFKSLPAFDIRNIIDVAREAVVVVPPVQGSTPGIGFPEM